MTPSTTGPCARRIHKSGTNGRAIPKVAAACFDPRRYAQALASLLADFDWSAVEKLAARILQVRNEGRQLFLCGNGGSAASAIHLANDLLYGVAPGGTGVRAECLCSNASVLTCLANDTGYENIFSLQLRSKGSAGDGLIVFSGSGNSANIIEAVREARRLGMWTCGILGFSGGAVLRQVDVAIHFGIDDMEMAEDLQTIAGHMLKGAVKAHLHEDSMA